MSKVFLITVSNSFEADMYESILYSCDIPIYKRARSGSEHLEIYLGMTNMGVDIYVDEENIDDAKEVLDVSEVDYRNSPETRGHEDEIKKPYWLIAVIIILIVIYLMPILSK